ncbi:MAG TPA: hypothetical protein VI895_04505, partial [Bdellovibrionota bacterium]|nr:hypothetical protein [Bdellovibrionota bacterium]
MTKGEIVQKIGQITVPGRTQRAMDLGLVENVAECNGIVKITLRPGGLNPQEKVEFENQVRREATA